MFCVNTKIEKQIFWMGSGNGYILLAQALGNVIPRAPKRVAVVVSDIDRSLEFERSAQTAAVANVEPLTGRTLGVCRARAEGSSHRVNHQFGKWRGIHVAITAIVVAAEGRTRIDIALGVSRDIDIGTHEQALASHRQTGNQSLRAVTEVGTVDTRVVWRHPFVVHRDPEISVLLG